MTESGGNFLNWAALCLFWWTASLKNFSCNGWMKWKVYSSSGGSKSGVANVARSPRRKSRDTKRGLVYPIWIWTNEERLLLRIIFLLSRGFYGFAFIGMPFCGGKQKSDCASENVNDTDFIIKCRSLPCRKTAPGTDLTVFRPSLFFLFWICWYLTLSNSALATNCQWKQIYFVLMKIDRRATPTTRKTSWNACLIRVSRLENWKVHSSEGLFLKALVPWEDNLCIYCSTRMPMAGGGYQEEWKTVSFTPKKNSINRFWVYKPCNEKARRERRLSHQELIKKYFSIETGLLQRSLVVCRTRSHNFWAWKKPHRHVRPPMMGPAERDKSLCHAKPCIRHTGCWACPFSFPVSNIGVSH